MIRRETRAGWLLVPQPAHAALAGEIARRWALHPVEPRASVLTACARHDDGWLAWESAAQADPESGRPLDFVEVALEPSLAIWRRGPTLVAADDPYAGLLVSGHGEALFEHKLAGGGLAPLEAARVRAYLEEQRAFRAGIERVHAIPAAWLGARWLANLRLLQLTDLISLIACWRAVEAPERLVVGDESEGFAVEIGGAAPAAPDVEAASIEATSIEATSIEAASVEAASVEGIRSTASGDDVLEVALWIAPWPFGDPARPFALEVPAHRLARRPWTTAALRAALAEAPGARLRVAFSSRPPRG